MIKNSKCEFHLTNEDKFKRMNESLLKIVIMGNLNYPTRFDDYVLGAWAVWFIVNNLQKSFEWVSFIKVFTSSVLMF